MNYNNASAFRKSLLPILQKRLSFRVCVRKSLLSARKARRLGAVQEFQKIVLHFRRKSVLMYICFRARNVQSLSSLREAETCSGALDEVLALN